ncbi:MAG: ABC transporter ATP-binding protein [Epsilonproteobacteria bacterium]|nr:ABC transporter ATP-binding protein [Campylobacterota bacterium]
MSLIKLENVYKEYKDVNSSFLALKDINLEIKKNELVILEGISGSGKSTLLSIIGGIDFPTQGKVEVDGKIISKLPDYHLSKFRNKTIGFVFQHFNLIDNLSLLDNILMPLVVAKENLKDAIKRAKEIAKILKIDTKLKVEVKRLSGGEKQRGAIARALINNASIILFDEPTANLDRDNSLNFLEILKELKSMGKTIIVATHDPIFNKLDSIRKVKIENGQIVK